jgi:hypothetical protein
MACQISNSEKYAAKLAELFMGNYEIRIKFVCKKLILFEKIKISIKLFA